MRETLNGQQAEACWLAVPGRAEIRRQELPPLPPGQALVRTLYSGISRGTESLVYAGKVPESEYARMRAPFQEGEFPGPVKYGYINVGIVLEGPEALVGRHTFCLYPHQTLYQVPVSALTVLPGRLPVARAVLAAGMETALNALWDAEIKIGDRVLVVGAGVIGALVAYLAKRVAGTSVQLLDVNAERSHLAKALGVEFATPEQGRGDVDLVVHASGYAAGLNTALELAGMEARIIELSWYGEQEVAVSLGQAFHAKRLCIQSSQVGRIPSVQASRWDYARRLRCALSLLSDPALDALICSESEFSELPQTLARVCAPKSTILCHRVNYKPITKES